MNKQNNNQQLSAQDRINFARKIYNDEMKLQKKFKKNMAKIF